MDPADVDELEVVAIDEVALQIEHVRESAREARSEVDTGPAEHAHDTTCHVLATVITGALDDRDRAGIAHCKALARNTGGKQLAARSAVQAGVAHDDGFIVGEARIARMPQDDLAAGHSFAD